MRATKGLTPTKWSEDLPGIKELSSRLRFSFSDAQIWLDEERMILLHSSSLAALRKELIDSLGMERPRGLMTRIGFAAGTRDAQLVKKFYPHDSDLEIMHKGPMLHTLEGIAKVEPIKLDIDIAKGIYDVEGRWVNGIEGYVHRSISENEEGPGAGWNWDMPLVTSATSWVSLFSTSKPNATPMAALMREKPLKHGGTSSTS